MLSLTKSYPFSELQLTLTPAPPELAQQMHTPDLFSISHSSSSTMKLCILSLFEYFPIFEKFIILSDLLLCKVLRVLSKHCNSLSSTLWPVRDIIICKPDLQKRMHSYRTYATCLILCCSSVTRSVITGSSVIMNCQGSVKISENVTIFLW